MRSLSRWCWHRRTHGPGRPGSAGCSTPRSGDTAMRRWRPGRRCPAPSTSSAPTGCSPGPTWRAPPPSGCANASARAARPIWSRTASTGSAGAASTCPRTGGLAHELTGAGNGGGRRVRGEAGAVTGRPVAAPVAGHPRHTFRGPEHETGLDGRCGPRDTEEDGHDRQRPRTETPYAVHRPRPADRQPFRRDGVPRVTTRSRRRRRGKRGSPPASPGGDWWGCQERSGKRRGCRVGDRPPRPLPGAAH